MNGTRADFLSPTETLSERDDRLAPWETRRRATDQIHARIVWRD